VSYSHHEWNADDEAFPRLLASIVAVAIAAPQKWKVWEFCQPDLRWMCALIHD
jgi:hypothetical protein